MGVCVLSVERLNKSEYLGWEWTVEQKWISGMGVCVLSVRSFFIQNKKFWEELIAYFPWHDMGHIEKLLRLYSLPR
jgi:hypothetical protein